MITGEMFTFYRNALGGTKFADALCKEYKEEWRNSSESKTKLAKLALRQQSLPYFITYCYNGLGLSKDYIKKEFANFINRNGRIHDADNVKGYNYSIFVDYDKDIYITDDVCALMWCNISRARIKETKATIIYCGCDTKLHISCDGYNNVIIYLFDKSRVFLDDIDDNSNVTVYKFSEDCGVLQGKYCLGTVKQHDKQLRL